MTRRNDNYWMRRALKEAAKSWGETRPNPMVGAVVTTADGTLISVGHHEFAGGPHAEVNALRAAGDAARGGTLYVTLEPCSTFGRTPPCTDAIIRAGIRRVCIGCLDDNPRHAGAAIELLRAQGITIETGFLEKECRSLNEHFFWWIRNQRPYVILKMAVSLDGKIALANGESKWITGPQSLKYVQRLRKLSGMIMVGGETARLDAPRLTVRDPADWKFQPDAAIWTSRGVPPEFSATAPDIPSRRVIALKPQTREEWLSFLENEGARGCQLLLLEGGGELAAAALKAGIVNKVMFFIAPKIIGGRTSRSCVGGDGIARLVDAIQLSDVKITRLGADILYEAYL